MDNRIYPVGIFICPICNKEFKANDDTRYLVKDEYTCSWKCFLKEVKRIEEEKAERKKSKAISTNKK